jgi:hypothetical protein
MGFKKPEGQCQGGGLGVGAVVLWTVGAKAVFGLEDMNVDRRVCRTDFVDIVQWDRRIA